MKALVLTPSRREAKVEELQPTPGPGEVVIRVQAVALNPVDAIYVSSPIAKQDKSVVGSDFAGIVDGASPELATSSDPRTKPGARVAGFLQGACSVNDRPGAFSEYITAPYDLIWVISSSVSFEAASTVSLCGLTAAQGLFARLGLPSPFHDDQAPPQDNRKSSFSSFRLSLPRPFRKKRVLSQNKENQTTFNILIYGSSTSIGLYAAQLVKLMSKVSERQINLIGAAKPSNHNFLRQKPYSYDFLVDYHDPDWVMQVKAATGGKGVDFAMDCISEDSTVYKCDETLSPSAKFAVFHGPVDRKYDLSKLTVEPVYGAVWEGLGVEIGYNDNIIPANSEARDFAAKFFKFLSTEKADGGPQLEPNTARIMPGGLEKIFPDGFALLRSGSTVGGGPIRKEDYMRPISAEKLVYRV